ncbi:hypothetical protein AVEN_117198-1 [Araneus ventricosus]|uniref:Uncharacterized protein n=1 Tax=Araneus ventricosus TaxID=182803 RepID=A0A4Y2AY15_ARAVE|nr:hypothetical protein AVEN_117198-1 [Araneus ventricosus]
MKEEEKLNPLQKENEDRERTGKENKEEEELNPPQKEKQDYNKLANLEDNEHWNKALEEAAADFMQSVCCYATNMFDVFSRTVMHGHKETLSEDILHQARIQQKNMDLNYCDAICNRALIDIEDKIILIERSNLKRFGRPQSSRKRDSVLPSQERRERNYDTDALIK